MLAAAYALLYLSQPVAPPESPSAFLQWSMDRYRSFRSFQANVTCTVDGAVLHRSISVALPNRFAIRVKPTVGTDQAVISDGKVLVESSSTSKSFYAAPSHIGFTSTRLMRFPTSAASLLYKVMLGSRYLHDLVDTKPFPVIELPAEQGLRQIRFSSKEGFGIVTMAIEPKTGLIRSIVCRQESSSGRRTIRETYESILVNQPIMAKVFEPPKVPQGAKLGRSEVQHPPVPLGDAAPNVLLTKIDGKPVSIRSLRGHLVLLDFWATWCGPCKESLPHSDELQKLYGAKGLVVLAVTAEEPTLVRRFWNATTYAMAPVIDKQSVANKAYGVTSIPTFVIIDAQGRLTGYFVGSDKTKQVRASVEQLLKIDRP